MTTSQTIDGVPLLPCPFCGGEPYGTRDHYVHDDLSPMPCVECRSCSAHLKAEDWNLRVQPAAQPQGEPVAWLDQVSGAIVTHKLKPMLCESGFEIPLYAEQPAPVAVVMPERMSRQQVINNTHYSEGWNACLDELKRLNPSM